ncbi:MAG: sensor domain-containing diguanylate cyclase [Bosea sp. (in: a-proteobacteria)]
MRSWQKLLGVFGGLRLQLCCLALVVALPITISQMRELSHDREQAHATAERAIKRYAEAVVKAQSDAVNNVRLTLDVLSKVPDVVSGSTDACNLVMRDIAETREWAIGFHSATVQGHVGCTNLEAARNISIFDRAYFREALASGEFTVSDFLVGRVSRKPSLAAALPVFDKSGKPIRVLVATLDLQAIEKAAKDVASRVPGSMVAVFDSAGTLLARYPAWSSALAPGQNYRNQPLFGAIARSHAGTTVATDLDGEERLISYMSIPNTKSKIVVGFSQAQITAEIDRKLWSSTITMAILLAGLVLTGVFGGYLLIVRPLREIGRAAQTIGSGGQLPGKLPRQITREFAELSRDVAIMARRIRKRESALVKAKEQLNEMAFSDGLTRIANRRRFDQTLESLKGDMTTAGQNISLLMLDIDFFKRFNDRYGHGRGDSALICVAHEVELRALAADAVAYRVGGEEFAVLMPGRDLEAALQLGHEICSGVEARAMPHADGLGQMLTVSVGVTSVQIGDPDWAANLMRHADAALYEAKKAGRNRVSLPALAKPARGNHDHDKAA